MRPCVALVNRILANVQDPFLIRPSAGVSGRTLIVTLPGDTADLQSAAAYLVTSAPGFIRLLKLLKTGMVASGRASTSTESHQSVVQICFSRLDNNTENSFYSVTSTKSDITPEQLLPKTTSPSLASPPGTSESRTGSSRSGLRSLKRIGREAKGNSANNTQRYAAFTHFHV